MKRAVIAATAGIALAGAIGVGVASAATGSGPASWVSEALSGLVKDGTLDQQQADAVVKALEDSREEARADRQQRREESQERVETLLQDTLGISAQELRTRLQDGKTLKEIAGDKADELGDGLVTLAKERSAAAVADGRLTQDQADGLVSRVEQRVKAWLAGDDDLARLGGLGMLLGDRGMHGHGAGGRGMGRGLGPDDATSSPSPSTAATSGSATT